MNETEAKLLDAVQQEVPLVERPFAEIGRRFELDEAAVIDLLRPFKTGPRPVIRQISAIFDSASLGYQSTLVAAQVDEARLACAVSVINDHPGVSHNYKRNHKYNLWYTLAVPPDSRLGLQRTVDLLHARSGATVTRLMPTLKLYKIGVRLQLPNSPAALPATTKAFTHEHRRHGGTFSLSDSDKPLIRVLQQDLPLTPRPFDAWAEQAGVTTQTLLAAATEFEQRRWMRRFSAVLRHREIGFTANAMGVWQVRESQADEFGATAASFDAVSHCYLRPTYPDWSYNLFTMIHGARPDDCQRILREISRATGVTGYDALYSTHEYKKVRVQYFMGDIEAWEAQARQSNA